MNLTELVGHLKSMPEAEKLISIELPDIEFDLAEVFMKGRIDITSDIVLFNAESIPEDLVIEVGGVTYENLFPLYLLQEMVEDHTIDASLNDVEIAQRILDYRRKDA